MKQVVLTITHYHKCGHESEYTITSPPLFTYDIEQFIVEHIPTNEYYRITNVVINEI